MIASGFFVMPRDKGDLQPTITTVETQSELANLTNNETNNATTSVKTVRLNEANNRSVSIDSTNSTAGCLRIRNNSKSFIAHKKQQLDRLNKQSSTEPQQRTKLMLLSNHKSSSKKAALEEILTNCSTKAMRYYRIWIYTCNAVLLVSVLTFSIVASKVLVTDYRRHLIPGLTMYQPSFLYAYFAIFTQSGVLQVVGCLGALRLSERLLNVYWLMLLMLLFGDVVIGIFWMFRLDKMLQELRPGLKFKLFTEYGQNPELTALWDRLQIEANCCGVQNALDFTSMRQTSNMVQWGHPIHNPIDNTSIRIFVPESCCALQEIGENSTIRCQTVYRFGCEDKLRSYLKQTAEILFLIGYCVIAFVKLCFLGILRYEIREMIQKIKLLKTEMESRPSIASIDLGNSGEAAQTTSPTHAAVLIPCEKNLNGSVRAINIDAGTESERESLLVNEPETPAHNKHRASVSAEDLEYHRKSSLHKKLFPGDPCSADSESHCALLTDESVIKTPPNGNNNYEMKEFQQFHTRQYSRMSNPDTQTQNM